MSIIHEPKVSIIDAEILWWDLKEFLIESFDVFDTVTIYFNPIDNPTDIATCSVSMPMILDNRNLNQSLHSLTGPALTLSNHTKFFLHGELVSFEEWLNHALITEKEKTLLRLKYG